MIASSPSSSLHRIATFAHQWEWLFLLLFIPVTMFFRPVFSPALLLLPAFWFIRRWVTGRFAPATPLNLPILVLLTMTLVSLYATYDIEISAGKVAGICFGICLFFAIVTKIRNNAQLSIGVAVLLLAACGIAFLGFLGADWPQKIFGLKQLVNLLPKQFIALPGTGSNGINANQLTGVLLWVSPIAFALSGHVLLKRRHYSYWLQLTLLLMTIGLSAMLLLSQSRGGYAGLAAALALMISLALPKHWRKIALLFYFAAIIGALLYVIRADANLLPMLLERSNEVAGGYNGESLTTRVDIWTRAITSIQDFPLTGMGMNSFRHIVPILYPLFSLSEVTDIAHAHNHLLQTALDLGIPGLIAYISMWLVLIMMLIKQLQFHHTDWRNAFSIGSCGALLGYFVYGMLDTVALGARPGFIFWILIGLITAAYQLPTPTE